MTSFDAPRIQRLVKAHRQRGDDPWLLIAALYARDAPQAPRFDQCIWAEYPNGMTAVRCGRSVSQIPSRWEGPLCSRLLRDGGDRLRVPLCDEHIELLYERATAVEPSRRLPTRSTPELVDRPMLMSTSAPGFVYYGQRPDGAIKIGYSVDPPKRLKDLGAVTKVRLLAMEPGDLALEARRHLYWQDAHLHGEWFEPVPSLMEHISSLGGSRRSPTGVTEAAQGDPPPG